jgi:Ca2+-binding EF-hand superfamily protein
LVQLSDPLVNKIFSRDYIFLFQIFSLGCCPSEAELQEILVQVEDQEMTGSVKLNRFLPVMAEILQENRSKE